MQGQRTKDQFEEPVLDLPLFELTSNYILQDSSYPASGQNGGCQ
jgi:hypothetical protein